MAKTPAPGARPLVSVIIPHLNQPDFLRTCLDSLAVQDWPAAQTEIIVVDNGSRALPDLAALGFPHVKLLTEATPGPAPELARAGPVARRCRRSRTVPRASRRPARC